MTSLSIHLPNFVATASADAASALGISMTAFIKQAIIHELEHIEHRTNQGYIITTFQAMSKSNNYMIESKEVADHLNSELPEEEDQWWSKK
jgi:hypothetical protein